jgi:hypothetical protein
MMKMRAEPWLLLVAALSVGGLGCGTDSPSTSSDDDEVTTDDDQGDDDSAPEDDDTAPPAGDDDDGAPSVDAGTGGKRDSGAPQSPPKSDATVGAKPSDAGTVGKDASARPDKDGGSEDVEDAGSMAPPAGGGGKILPPADPTKMGPFMSKTEILGAFRVWYPTELGKDGLKHPIFVWGTGSGALPDRYNDHFGIMASHGFVIISPNKTQKGAADMKAALEYILAENGKSGGTFGGKLDPDRVGMGGHSQGSIATFDHEATEMRLRTTIHIAGGSFDGQGSAKVKTPTAYICGETDFALSNCQRDFMNVKGQPTFFSVLKGVDHVQCARSALPGMIAWLRWHLAGETELAKAFSMGGQFHMGIWGSQLKNWKY